MRLVFLPSTRRDLKWFHTYYGKVFADGRERAIAHYRTILQALKDNPHIGRVSDVHPDVRELPVPRTPFVILYRLRGEFIEILRIVDARADWR